MEKIAFTHFAHAHTVTLPRAFDVSDIKFVTEHEDDRGETALAVVMHNGDTLLYAQSGWGGATESHDGVRFMEDDREVFVPWNLVWRT